MKANDYSVTAAISCLIQLNLNRDPDTEAVTDYSLFLPYPGEYQDQLQQNAGRLQLNATTASYILKYYGLFNSRTIGLVSVFIDEITQIARV